MKTLHGNKTALHKGLLVIKTDNRGSSGRTTAFEKSISLLLGPREAADQAAACVQLKNKGLLLLHHNSNTQNTGKEEDVEVESGVGIYGTSYGGFLSAMAYFTQPDIFSCAFSAAPVIFWEAYSTHYTERYLSLPSLNPVGYRLSSVIAHIANKQHENTTNHGRKLLVLHGAVDENVLLQHSLVFADALIKQQIPFEFVCLPSSRHGPSTPHERRHFRQKLLAFFAQALLPKHKQPLPPPPSQAGKAA